MFATLPETGFRRRRDPRGIAVSVTAHLAVAALATLAATDTVTSSPPPPVEDTAIVYLPPPPAPSDPGRGGGQRGSETPIAEHRMPTLPQAPVDVPVTLPPVDPLAPIIDETAAELARRAHRTLASGGGRGTATGGDGGQHGFARTAERGAAPLPGNPRPAYPTALRSAGLEGAVLAEFVVDTAGRVEPGTVVILASDHALFEAAVRDVLPRLRFAPAEAAGRAVRQRVRQPFTFRLER